jgi:hypothetical protein
VVINPVPAPVPFGLAPAIVGWLARADGSVVAMVTDSTGSAEPITELVAGTYPLVHPDAVYPSEGSAIR